MSEDRTAEDRVAELELENEELRSRLKAVEAEKENLARVRTWGLLKQTWLPGSRPERGMPKKRHGGRYTAWWVLAILVLNITAGLHAQPSPSDHRQILQLAIDDARAAKDLVYRTNGFLRAVATLEKVDPPAAAALLQETLPLVEKLGKKPTVGEALALGAASGAIHAIFFGALGVPASSPLYRLSLAGLINTNNQLLLEDARRYLEEGDRLTLDLLELLAPNRPYQAFELAVSIGDPYGRALAVEVALRGWPPNDRAGAVHAVRELLARIQKEIDASPKEPDLHPPGTLLAALAGGVEADDRELALQLARRVTVQTDESPWALRLAYGVLARLEPEAAVETLEKLISAGDDGRLQTFASGVAETRPDSAWRALEAVRSDDPEHLVTTAAILRQIAGQLSGDEARAARSLALALPARAPVAKPAGFKSKRKLYKGLDRYAITTDAVVSLGALDPDAALEQCGAVEFNWMWVGFYFFELRTLGPKKIWSGSRGILPQGTAALRELSETFLPDLIRLDLAVSWLDSRPQKAFEVLDSFDDTFWKALLYTTLRVGGARENHRLVSLVRGVKHSWPATAANSQTERPDRGGRALRDFAEVAELLDTTAVEAFNLYKKIKIHGPLIAWTWHSYPPFAMTYAGRAFQAAEPRAAEHAFERATELARSLNSPGREWALCQNAVAWRESGISGAAQAGKEAASAVGALSSLKDWWEGHSSGLVFQLARLDPAAALRLAQSKSMKRVRTFALTAVVSGQLQEAEQSTAHRGSPAAPSGRPRR